MGSRALEKFLVRVHDLRPTKAAYQAVSNRLCQAGVSASVQVREASIGVEVNVFSRCLQRRERGADKRLHREPAQFASHDLARSPGCCQVLSGVHADMLRLDHFQVHDLITKGCHVVGHCMSPRRVLPPLDQIFGPRRGLDARRTSDK